MMIKTDSGLQYEDLLNGRGRQAAPGDDVTIHYTGRLQNGEVFDSSLDRDQPLTFTLGAGQVIAGWDEGIAGMKRGSVRRLIVPAELGYGAEGAGTLIPPKATLIFEIELLAIES